MASALTPCPLLINGEWLTPKIGSTPAYNPSTGGVIAGRPAS